MIKIVWKRLALLSLVVTAVVWLLSFLIAKLNLGTIKGLFVTIPATSGLTTTFGDKSIALLGGLIPSIPTLPNILILLVSVFLTLLVGNLIVELLFKGKHLKGFLGLGEVGGLVATYIILGALVGYLLFLGLKAPAMMTFVGFAIHTLLIALGSAFVVKLLKLKI
jgi:hypothetical protein